MPRMTTTELQAIPGWKTTPDDSFLPDVDNSSDLGSASFKVRSGYFGTNLTAAQFRLSALNTAPSSAADTGALGEIRIVDGFIYVCVATNTWQKVAIATW